MGGFLETIYSAWNQIFYAISSFRIFDIIDIAIIAFIIYKAIGFLRNSRAGQLVKGLVIIFAVYFIASWWKLPTTSWFLSRFVDYIIIAAAIVFQPELRRILEKMGHTKFVGGQGIDDEDELNKAIDDIARAAGMMQENRIGALIVFERTTQLGEIIDTGTIINATTSISMVNNVFFPKSPLHDGALIVRDGRLYAAGCILPLTQREDLSSQLGTRHRAAIGMSENSDAVILVVSEETGNISIVSNGQIRRNFNAISAANELKSLLIVNKEKESTNKVITALKNINLLKKAGKDSEDNENPKN